MKRVVLAMGLLALLAGCEGSPDDLARREDLSTATTLELCFASGIRPASSAERARLLDEVRRRGEITQRERDTALQRRVFIGMSQTGAQCSWGLPYSINRTTFSFGVHEQWVYVSGPYNIPSSFLYFEDGRLTAIQN